MPTASPCIDVCELHPDSGLCRGCYRSMDEIARWSAMTERERRRVLEELDGRSHDGTPIVTNKTNR